MRRKKKLSGTMTGTVVRRNDVIIKVVPRADQQDNDWFAGVPGRSNASREEYLGGTIASIMEHNVREAFHTTLDET